MQVRVVGDGVDHADGFAIFGENRRAILESVAQRLDLHEDGRELEPEFGRKGRHEAIR